MGAEWAQAFAAQATIWRALGTGVKLPVVSGLNVAAIVDQKVAGTLAQLNGRLEQLVAQALDRELDKLVGGLLEAELETRTNALAPPGETADAPGANAVSPPLPGQNAPATKVCVGCGESKALGEYERGRNRCRSCRRRQVAESRQRRQQAEADDQERPRTSA